MKKAVPGLTWPQITTDEVKNFVQHENYSFDEFKDNFSYQNGDPVEINGLVKAAQYNGSKGKI